MRSESQSGWGAHADWLAQFMMLTTLWCGLLATFSLSQATLGSIAGVALDTQNHPIAGETVTLLNSSGVTLQSTSTDHSGAFRFSQVSPGRYRIATREGEQFLVRTSVSVSAGETAQVTLTLGTTPAAPGDPAFFDQPTFTVAGVTDTTNLAVHGSDKVARKKDELTKDIVDLTRLPLHASGTADDPKDAETVRRLIAAGNYTSAQSQLQDLLRTRDRAELHTLLGSIDEALGEPVDSVREYQRAAEMDPSELNLMRWGSEFLLHHAPDAALQIFSEGARRFPSSARMLSARGVAYYIRGSYELATADLMRASDMDPNATDADLFLGRIVEVETSVSDALLGHLARFAEQSPHNPQANYFYALALWKRNPGESAAVSALLRKAVELDPQFAAALLQLGIVHESQDPAYARAQFERAIAVDPQMPEAHFRLAQLYRKSGQDTKSHEELALFQKLTKAQSEEAARERHDIQQFVFATGSPAH